MDPQSPSASQSFAMPLAGGEDALRATLAAALEALESEREARRRAEAALAERDRKVAEVERLASLGSWEQTLAEPLDAQPVRWSPEQLRIHGLEGEGAPATFGDFMARVHPEDRESVAAAVASAADTGDVAAISYRVVRADGQFRWLYAQAQRVPATGGAPGRLIGTSRDVTEHHLGMAALQERERTLDEVEELAGLGTWEWHLPSDTITWSREQRRIHGLPQDAGTQTFAQFLDRVHPDDRQRVVDECERLLATKVPFSFPYRVVRPDGSLREMQALGKLLPDPAGTGERMVGISQDVTERNAADRALRASEARFRDLFEQFPHSVKVYAPDGSVVRVNRAYERLWGLTLEQVAKFNPLRDVEMADIGAMVRRAFAGETVVLPPVLFDPREYAPDTEPPAGMEWPRWVQASYFPIRGADGEVLEVVAVHQDVTDQRAAEAALRVSEESYRTIFENSNDAIFVTDPETGSVVDANRRACEMCDTTLDELRADAASIIWNGPEPYTAATAREQTRRAMEGEAQRFEWMSIHPRTGAPIWGEVSLQRVVLAGKARVLALVRDIADRKAAEEALRRSEESYRTIFELSNDPIYVHDVETGAILDANRRACEAAGMTLDQVKQRGMQLIAGGPEPFTQERAMEHVRLAAAGEPQRFEWMTGISEGQVWSEVSLNRVNIGGVDRLVATARDITERKRAEQALRDREESYRTIFDLAGAGLWVHDIETGAFLDVNQTATELYGWSVDEQKAMGVVGLAWGEPPFTIDDAMGHVGRAIAGEPQRFEWKGRHRDGHPVWAEITLRRVTILGEDRLLATAREISEWKQAQEALRRANEELEQRVRERTAELADANEALEEEVAEHEAAQEALLERTQELEGVFHALPDLYFRLDPDGTITDHRAGRAAGLYAPLPDFRGRRMQELLPAEAADRLTEALDESGRTGELVCVEYRLMDGDTPLDFEARVVPLADGTRIAVTRDISERKAAERELERRRREAEQVAETLRQQALVFETLAEAVVITSAEGRITDWNPAAERMFGYPRRAVVGRPGGIVNPPGREPGINPAVVAALDRDGSWSGEVPFVRADGTEGIAEAVVVSQVDDDGRRIALICAHRDVTARKRAEAEVVRQKAFFEEIIASLESGVAVFDPQLRYTYASPNSIRDAEIREWVVGKTVREYGERKGLSEEVIRKRQDGLERALRTKRTTEFEEEIRATDGTPRHVIRRSLPVLDENGQVLRIIGYSLDITERVRMAEVVRQSEEHFRALIENAHDITCILDPLGVMTYQSPSLHRLLGWEPEEMIGRSTWQFIHPDDVPRVVETMSAILSQPGTSHRVEYRFQRKDGEWRTVEAIGRTLSPDTSENGLVANLRDVTERQLAEQALQEREEHFRRLIENAHDITCILGADGTMTYLSPSILRVLGYAPEELEGRNSFEFIHPDDAAAVASAIRDVVESPAGTGFAEYRFRHADGSWRHLEAVGRMVVPGEPESGFVSNIRDVTERKHAEEALREATLAAERARAEAERARAEAERANLAKSEFLSRMSHELRTPMNSILGFGQVLARAELRVEQQKHVQHILKAGRHLLRLINEVLEIARIEAGRQSFSLEPVHVGTVMQEAIGLVRPMAEQHGVEVEEGASTGRDGFVHADRQRLTQVLLNLLSNAIKYNREGGCVRLTCRAGETGDDGEPRIWLRVEDTGHGIPEARVHQLFTPFARLGAEQTEVEGTGLGLALSLRLAEAMGGTLELERSGPEGSVFRLGLAGAAHPLRRVEDAGIPAAAAEDEEHGTATLLYVEDNLANLDLVETFLASRPGWKLVPALQGRIGVELAREHRPDLVLLDLHLPDITGDEVLRRLRADPRTATIPVVIISADATRDSLDRLRAAGADAYLTKPLDLDDFLATLEAHLPAGPGAR